MPQDEATHIPERLVLKCSLFAITSDGIQIERAAEGHAMVYFLEDVAKPNEVLNGVKLDHNQMRELATWLLKELHK